MIKCAVFDLDGTLLDTVNSIAFYANKALARHGLPAIEAERFNYFAGDGAEALIQRSFAFHGVQFPKAELSIITKEYIKDYNSDPCYLTKVFPKIYDLLKLLKEKGIRVCVFSNKPHSSVSDIVNHFFGESTFDYVLGATEGLPKKPDPKGLLEILGRLGVNSEECLFIGDTSVDIETGKNAGAKTCGVLWGFREREELSEAGADYIVENALEILEVL